MNKRRMVLERSSNKSIFVSFCSKLAAFVYGQLSTCVPSSAVKLASSSSLNQDVILARRSDDLHVDLLPYL